MPRTRRADAEAWCTPCEILGAEPHAPRRQEKTVATTWVGADAGDDDARGSLVAGDDDDKRRLNPRPHAPSSTTDADTRTAT